MYPEHRAGLGADTTTPPQAAPSSGIGWGSLFVGVLVGVGVGWAVFAPSRFEREYIEQGRSKHHAFRKDIERRYGVPADRVV